MNSQNKLSNKPKIIVAGTVSNVGKRISKELPQLVNALSGFEIASIILVESDSSDNTIDEINALTIPNLQLVTLGSLRTAISNRIDRIRYCRNIYIEQIRKVMRNKDIEYVVIADLDGMNRSINRKSIDSCFGNYEWDVVLANQTLGYYDLLPLRAENWLKRDCFETLREIQESMQLELPTSKSILSRIRTFFLYDKCRKKAIYSNMRRIPRKSDWVEVDSGFGGLGIYKSYIFELFDYSETSQFSEPRSEHLALNEKIRANSGKIMINPRLINNHWNTYNLNRFTFIRILRLNYWELKKFLKSNRFKSLNF
jgi:hypothetical protein